MYECVVKHNDLYYCILCEYTYVRMYIYIVKMCDLEPFSKIWLHIIAFFNYKTSLIGIRNCILQKERSHQIWSSQIEFCAKCN